jgi:hypothetical protein
MCWVTDGSYSRAHPPNSRPTRRCAANGSKFDSMRGTPETAPDWVIKALEEKDKEHAEACREEFRERANLIASDWSKLRRASDTISDVRSRWTAHLEVEYESTTKSYRIVDPDFLASGLPNSAKCHADHGKPFFPLRSALILSIQALINPCHR